MPPLAERRDDILPLARHFLEPGFELQADAERALLRHDWPGNVRELRNCIQRACLLASVHADRRRRPDAAGRSRRSAGEAPAVANRIATRSKRRWRGTRA